MTFNRIEGVILMIGVVKSDLENRSLIGDWDPLES